ncbi:hypothetical protein CHS0354_030109 [Potamilus streckersoni]|uniref:Mandelate racemase/muconate lactonizing enzyme C-terminal domain-containing protein n=1 Tax=Potamilus streckersoni TaxID=2493646 RepID=A0AAE0VG47_9BIVA|nr:hypothetical protein CHS0354_030109 [Potamilus streckersoni]
MGKFRISRLNTVISWGITILIIILNYKVVYDFLTDLINTSSSPVIITLLTLPPVVISLLFLFYAAAEPVFEKFYSKEISSPHPQASVFKIEHPAPFRKIGIGIDFGRTDISAINHALRIGTPETQYILIHVVESAAARALPLFAAGKEAETDMQELQKYADDMRQRGINAECSLKFGDVSEAFVKTAQENGIELLVMASHNKGTLHRLFRGTVISEIARKVNIPTMALHASLIKYPLIFKIPAGTSRGTLRQKTSYFIRVWESDGRFGIGECSLLPGLSIESESTAEKILTDICRRPEYYRERINDELSEYPSVRFGFETAIKDLQTGGAGCLFPSAFTDGADSIDINALVWMGDTDTMQKEAESKLNAGCRCIKLKIGVLEFEAECRLIEFIRSHPLGKTVDIRLDANGAFRPEELSEKLDSLARFHIHSIEQPLPKGLSQCIPAKRPIPIALDEEIIGIRSVDEKKRLLDRIYPDFLVLKPGLLGGFAACREWINLCETYGIGWWITSALESNIGLSAIAQWAYTLFPKIPQGLGTGSLFINNIPAQTETVPEHRLFFRPHISRDFSSVGWLINRHSPKNEHREEFHKTRVTFFPGYAENPCITANAEKLSESPDVPLYIKEFDRMTRQWHNTEDYIEISTSGSTGIPKSVGILKKYITYSAQSTLDFLSVRRGAHFLLCLPPQFIGGMMVYVRAALCRGSLTVCPPNLIADSALPGYYDVVSVTPYLLMKTA